jgi:hypothetical protein
MMVSRVGCEHRGITKDETKVLFSWSFAVSGDVPTPEGDDEKLGCFRNSLMLNGKDVV